jgi:hypothetical protein
VGHYDARLKKLEEVMLPRTWKAMKIGVGRLLPHAQGGWSGIELEGQFFARHGTENQRATFDRACAAVGVELLVHLVSPKESPDYVAPEGSRVS